MGTDNDLTYLLDRILKDGVLTSSEHDLLFDLIGLDGEIDDTESALISRIFDLIDKGELKVVNEERDQFHTKH